MAGQHPATTEPVARKLDLGRIGLRAPRRPLRTPQFSALSQRDKGQSQNRRSMLLDTHLNCHGELLACLRSPKRKLRDEATHPQRGPMSYRYRRSGTCYSASGWACRGSSQLRRKDMTAKTNCQGDITAFQLVKLGPGSACRVSHRSC